ncbi:hypothetical protein Golomagni_04665 [Golovinomyces magnicellulatus]|nr:hypothetical protein Golomagni_04665 [Golovinomyces magnicellulatus]
MLSCRWISSDSSWRSL